MEEKKLFLRSNTEDFDRDQVLSVVAQCVLLALGTLFVIRDSKNIL